MEKIEITGTTMTRLKIINSSTRIVEEIEDAEEHAIDWADKRVW